MQKVQLEPSWLACLAAEFEQPYMLALQEFLQQRKAQGRVIYPPKDLIFNALNSTPFDNVKVVILGQDPYHGANQAHGLCFSVPVGVALPPSLKNIFKEIERDLHIPVPAHGCLQHWADQGVLLLNATLTVEDGDAGAHQRRGWETFTDKIIQCLNDRRDNIVFILWGSYAQKKGAFIDARRHLVLKSPHPSPLSAHRGFFGNRHFSITNRFLIEHGLTPIDWALPDVGK